jgi:YjbE family integral membrane protein
VDLGPLFSTSINLSFFTGLISIVLIDLVLAGDNAIVIAMAARSLPPIKRKKGIILGAGSAVLLRVFLTYIVSQVLHIPYLKLSGGLLISFMAAKLLTEEWSEGISHKETFRIRHAIKRIVVADITMSLDNMLAVAGVSKDNLFLLIFGLGLSIFFVVTTAGILAKIMDKYPIIIYGGSALLGKVAGEMIMTDPSIISLLHPSKVLLFAVEIIFAAGVIIAGRFWMKWKSSKKIIDNGE